MFAIILARCDVIPGEGRPSDVQAAPITPLRSVCRQPDKKEVLRTRYAR